MLLEHSLRRCNVGGFRGHIMLTCPCNVYPLTPHFYIVKLGFTVVYIVFLIFALKHRIPTIYVTIFHLKIIVFRAVKKLHARVKVMIFFWGGGGGILRFFLGGGALLLLYRTYTVHIVETLTGYHTADLHICFRLSK